MQSNSCYAYVKTITEWYHPILRHTLIISGDCHEARPQDNRQVGDSIQAIKKYNAYTIIEAGVNESYNPEVGFLNLLPFALQKYGCGTSYIEFRYGRGKLKHILKEIRSDYPTHYGQKKHLSQEEVKEPLFESFKNAGQNSSSVIAELTTFIAQKKEKGESSPAGHLIDAIESIINDVRSLHRHISQKLNEVRLPQDHEERRNTLISFLIDNFFESEHQPIDNIEDENQPRHKWSLLKTAFWLNDRLLDARILKVIIENQHRPLIFIFAGQWHVANLDPFLKQAGYIIKRNHETLSDKHPVDIGAFMKRCKTCTKSTEPPLVIPPRVSYPFGSKFRSQPVPRT